MKFILVCFHGNRLSRQGLWGSAGPWCAVCRDVPAWSMALFLGPWVWCWGSSTGPAAASPSCQALGVQSSSLWQWSVCIGGKTFLTVKTRENTDLSLPAWDGASLFHGKSFPAGSFLWSSLFPVAMAYPFLPSPPALPDGVSPLSPLPFGCHRGKGQCPTECL